MGGNFSRSGGGLTALEYCWALKGSSAFPDLPEQLREPGRSLSSSHISGNPNRKWKKQLWSLLAQEDKGNKKRRKSSGHALGVVLGYTREWDAAVGSMPLRNDWSLTSLPPNKAEPPSRDRPAVMFLT